MRNRFRRENLGIVQHTGEDEKKSPDKVRMMQERLDELYSERNSLKWKGRAYKTSHFAAAFLALALIKMNWDFFSREDVIIPGAEDFKCDTLDFAKEEFGSFMYKTASDWLCYKTNLQTQGSAAALCVNACDKEQDRARRNHKTALSHENDKMIKGKLIKYFSTFFLGVSILPSYMIVGDYISDKVKDTNRKKEQTENLITEEKEKYDSCMKRHGTVIGLAEYAYKTGLPFDLVNKIAEYIEVPGTTTTINEIDRRSSLAEILEHIDIDTNNNRGSTTQSTSEATETENDVLPSHLKRTYDKIAEIRSTKSKRMCFGQNSESPCILM